MPLLATPKRSRWVKPTAQDAERWWRAYQLAENDQAEELSERAEAGDEHARRQLASWLSDRARTEEAIKVIRPLADGGDQVAERFLQVWLSRLRERAAAGDEHARGFLAENPDWQQFRPEWA
jgi:hypothetical protein